jgi:hypothetical protein
MSEPEIEIMGDGDDIFVLADRVNVAKRGHPEHRRRAILFVRFGSVSVSPTAR